MSHKYTPQDNTLDFQIWNKTYLPTEENKTPIFNYKLVDFLFNTESHIKNVQSFRGSAKSITTCKLALYRVVSGLDRYVLIVSDTALQGEALISDIVQMIQFGDIPNVKLVRAISGELELLVNGKSSYILAKGAGSSMRGVKRGSLRATLCLTDDLVNDAQAMNRLRLARLEAWYFRVLRPSLHPNAEIWNIGTPLNQGDIFMKMCSLHPTFMNPLTNESWSDRFTPEWIERTKQEYKDAGQLRAWKQEFELVLTDSDTQLFDMNRVGFVDEDEVPEDLDWYMTCDLAISTESSADYSAFTSVGVSKTGIWYVYPHQGRYRPSESAGEIVRFVSQFNIYEVGVEQGATYLAMVEHLDQAQLDYQVYFSTTELKHGGKSKHSRIKALEPIVNAGRLRIIDVGEASEALVEQMELTDLETCSAKHDDILDSLAYMVRLAPNTYNSPLDSMDMGSTRYL